MAGGMGEAEQRRVRDAVELVAYGGVDARVAVPVDVAPQRRDAVDVATAVDVDEVGALGALDDQRLIVDPAALLGEGMPDVSVIRGDEIHDM